MKKLREIILTMSLSLILNSCMSVPPNPKLDPIIPPIYTKIPYKEIKQRANFVANALNEYFPEGVVIHLKKDKRYVVLNVLKDKIKTLEMTIYRFESPIKEKLVDHIIHEQDEKTTFYNINAAKVLAQGDYSSMAFFHDRRTNGLWRKDPEDFVRTKTREQEEITLKNGKLMTNDKIKQKDNLYPLLKNANILYLNVLEKFESY